MKKEELKPLALPIVTTLCGVLLYFMDWLTIFRATQKGGESLAMLDFRMITNQLSASLVMIAAIGIFVVRKHLNMKHVSTGGGVLVLWGLIMFAVRTAMPGAEVMLKVLGLPTHMFDFITEFLVLFGSDATGFLLAAPAILAPAMFILFLIGRKDGDEGFKPQTLHDRL